MAQEMPESTLEPLDILIVEDDEDLRRSLREMLEEEGYRVVDVPSGAEAVACCASRRFDLIVTDIKTPGTDGLSALEKVKEGNPEVAGIVITGYSTEEYALRAAKLQVENYLKKPFDVDDFLNTVDRLARKKRREQKHEARETAVSRALKWLAMHLVASRRSRPAEEVDRYFRHAVSYLNEYQDAREQLSLQSLAMLRLLRSEGLDWPAELREALPPRVARALHQNGDGTLQSRLDEWAAAFGSGDLPDPDESPEESSESLKGSVLNVALLLESAERFEEARTAFCEVLEGSRDPFERYPAHFGLARLARYGRRFEEMHSHLKSAIEETQRLGPVTHAQALAEAGILSAQVGGPEAEELLGQAVEAARKVRDTSSFALVTLALEHFFNRTSPRRNRLFEYLSQPEYFSQAVDSGEWLLDYLMSRSHQEPEVSRFLVRLLRASPRRFERWLLQQSDPQVLAAATAFLDVVRGEGREKVMLHLKAFHDEGIDRALSSWKKASQRAVEKKSLLRVFSFSGIRLYQDDQTLEISRKKPLLLLLYLLYRAAPVGEESVLDLFWPGSESKARASLRTALSYLRKLLAADDAGDPFLRQAGGLSVSDDLPVWFDFREFDSSVRKGRLLSESRPQQAMDCFRSAVRLYRGPFLENVYDDWAIEAREQTERVYEDCLRYLAEQNLAGKDWAEAYEHASLGLRKDPLSQPFCEMSMRALIELGRHHDALQIFDQCSAALHRELELEPSIEMIRCRELARLNI